MSTTPTRILVPTDFSLSANRVLPLAKKIAERFDAEIHLLHVRVLLDDPYVDSETLDEVERVLAVSEPPTRQALEEAGNNGRTPIRAHMKRGIVAAQIILDAITEYDCDLVIMGTHGRRGLKRLLTGSVAQEVVHHSPVPVLTIRADADDPRLPKKILVAVDFSERSLSAVGWAAAVAPALDAEITLLHVVEPPIYPGFYSLNLLPEKDREQIVNDCHNTLFNIASENLGDVPFATAVIYDHVAQGICSFAEKKNHDLVVLATKGLSGLAHIALGSVAERVVRLASTPVLTVRGS